MSSPIFSSQKQVADWKTLTDSYYTLDPQRKNNTADDKVQIASKNIEIFKAHGELLTAGDKEKLETLSQKIVAVNDDASKSEVIGEVYDFVMKFFGKEHDLRFQESGFFPKASNYSILGTFGERSFEIFKSDFVLQDIDKETFNFISGARDMAEVRMENNFNAIVNALIFISQNRSEREAQEKLKDVEKKIIDFIEKNPKTDLTKLSQPPFSSSYSIIKKTGEIKTNQYLAEGKKPENVGKDLETKLPKNPGLLKDIEIPKEEWAATKANQEGWGNYLSSFIWKESGEKVEKFKADMTTAFLEAKKNANGLELIDLGNNLDNFAKIYFPKGMPETLAKLNKEIQQDLTTLCQKENMAPYLLMELPGDLRMELGIR